MGKWLINSSLDTLQEMGKSIIFTLVKLYVHFHISSKQEKRPIEHAFPHRLFPRETMGAIAKMDGGVVMETLSFAGGVMETLSFAGEEGQLRLGKTIPDYSRVQDSKFPQIPV